MELVILNHISLAEDRQRKTFHEGPIIDLADDIERVGLMHPIVLRTDQDMLVAGERRLRAMTLLHNAGRTFECNGAPVPRGYIPVVRLSDRDEIDYFEAELIENLARLDLTWQEESQAKANLHALRLQQTHGKQTLQATVQELQAAPGTTSSITGLSEDVRLTQHFDDEEIRAAKSKKEAVKILDRKLTQERNAQLAQEWKGAAERKSPHHLLLGDSIEVMDGLPDNTYNVILTDPPYGIGAQHFGDQTHINHEYDDSFESWDKLMQRFLRRARHLTAPDAHMYIFCDISNFAHLQLLAEDNGWDAWKRPLIWYKGNIGTLPNPDYGPRYTYECVLYAMKGKKKTCTVGAHDVISIPSIPKPRHAAEKPVALYVELLRRSCSPGESVLDPFAGSGTIFPAATYLHLNATGIEKDQTSFDLAFTRMGEKYE